MSRLVLSLILLFPLMGCAAVPERPSLAPAVEVSLVNAPSSLFAQKVRVEKEGGGTRLYAKWPRPMLLGRDRSKAVLIELFDGAGSLLLSRKGEYGPGLATPNRRNRPLTLSESFSVPMERVAELRITFYRLDGH